MIDKLVVLGMTVHELVQELASREGFSTRGYESYVDLRETKMKLPARLYYRGRHDRRHKVEVVGVAKLGLKRTREVFAAIFPDLEQLRIYRIDLCVDLLGIPISYFAQRCHIPRVQNFKMFRRRGAVSIYLQSSRARTVVLYDKGRELLAKGNPLARILRPGDCLTRVEAQLCGSAVPFRELRNIRRYANFNPFENLKFARLRPVPDKLKPMQFLAATGLQSLIEERSQQIVSKMFPSSEWAWLKRKFLLPMGKDEVVPDLSAPLKKGVKDWIENRIRFPRATSQDGAAE